MHRRLTCKAAHILSLLLVAVLASASASAQVQRSFTNLGFEQPDLVTPGCRVFINAAQVPGWETTHPNNTTANSGGCVVAGGLGASPGPILELWQTPRDSNSGGTVTAPEGNQIAELNGEVPSRIYQNVCLVNGERVSWRFSHRGRGSSTVRDVAEMKVGGSNTVVRVGTTNSGASDTPVAVQGTVSGANIAGNASWVRYTGAFNYAGATGMTNIGFEAISASGGSANGNLLDDIQIVVSPFVEFAAPNSSSSETGPGTNKPAIRVSGNVVTAFNVTVLITGGTATLGTDYTTPGNSTTLNIAVPVGTYDGVSTGLFELPVTISNDTVSEANETIQFQIQPASGTPRSYLLLSSSVCGGSGQTTATYTIVDNDASISISKDAAAPVSVGGSLTEYQITYTVTVSNSSGIAATYTLTDTPGLKGNVSIVSARPTPCWLPTMGQPRSRAPWSGTRPAPA